MRLLLLVTLSICGFSQDRINSGGSDYVDVLGQTWKADTRYIGGTVSVGPIPSLAPDYYRTKRYGDFRYVFPAPDGTYNVTLYFIENVVGPRQRVFNVTSNDIPILTNYDIAEEVGVNVPTKKTFQVVASGGKGITIKFITVARSAIVNAIELEVAKQSDTRVWVSETFKGPDREKYIPATLHGFNTIPCAFTFMVYEVIVNTNYDEAVSVGWKVDRSNCDVIVKFGQEQENYYVVMWGGK